MEEEKSSVSVEEQSIGGGEKPSREYASQV